MEQQETAVPQCSSSKHPSKPSLGFSLASVLLSLIGTLLPCIRDNKAIPVAPYAVVAYSPPPPRRLKSTPKGGVEEQHDALLLARASAICGRSEGADELVRMCSETFF